MTAPLEHAQTSVAQDGSVAEAAPAPPAVAPPVAPVEATPDAVARHLAALQQGWQAVLQCEERWTAQWAGLWKERTQALAEWQQLGEQLACVRQLYLDDVAHHRARLGASAEGDPGSGLAAVDRRDEPSDRDALEEMLAHWQQRSAELQLAWDATREELAQLESQRNVLRSQLDEVQRRVQTDAAQYEARLHACQVEQEETASLAHTLRERIGALEQQLAERRQTQHQLETARQKLEKLAADRDSLSRELEQLRDQLAETRARCDRLEQENRQRAERQAAQPSAGAGATAGPAASLTAADLRHVFSRMRAFQGKPL